MNGNIGDILEKKAHAMANSNYNKQKKMTPEIVCFKYFHRKRKIQKIY